VTAPRRLSVRRSELPPPGASDRAVQISLRVPTDLGIIEEAVDLVARHCLASGIPPQAARFRLRVALCEALANAIVYGNRLDPTKQVQVQVVVTAERLSVQVCDEGDGFDPSTVPDPTAPDRVEMAVGRGLFLIRQLVDEVRFNDRGNSICMIMHRA
jgi:serine/threonine-protein kinase RsbW